MNHAFHLTALLLALLAALHAANTTNPASLSNVLFLAADDLRKRWKGDGKDMHCEPLVG